MTTTTTKTPTNDPARAGELAGPKFLFGGDTGNRYAVAPVHTRFGAIQWFVWDAMIPEPETGLASGIRQCATRRGAIAGLD